MRFVEDGPSIPDALLNARDEGRVVFFCGAGVSRARAQLPDFFGLATSVLDELGSIEGSDSREVLKKAVAIGKDLGVSGLISADRIFSLMEREFTVADIHAAVAKLLTPQSDPNVTAHQVLLRLGTTPSSKTQIVTTNFDRLFEKCGKELSVHQPPRLPFPSRYNDFNGIVYLHGRVNDSNTGSDESGLILSSSDLGYAYLSEGWATEFFREIVKNYVVVFVGYSADDPPIHYLLEGSLRTRSSQRRIYAFQAEESEEAIARWRHKGIDAISYPKHDNHASLWETLEKWAVRADDQRAWRRSVFDLAMVGPSRLLPHQRGQVAHIVSTEEGMREFVERKSPADWLCVFDASCRRASFRESGWLDSENPATDPFSLFGLDSDRRPDRKGTDSQVVNRPISSVPWDAFDLNEEDKYDFPAAANTALRGNQASYVQLPKRLQNLARWISSVSNEPATIWWAVRQNVLHPMILEGVAWRLERCTKDFSPVVLKAWRYLLTARRLSPPPDSQRWYNLKLEIEREGWSRRATREYTAHFCPFLSAKPAMMSDPWPPRSVEGLKLRDVIDLDVQYPVPEDIDIPDQWLNEVIRGFRINLAVGIELSKEINDFDLFRICPIAQDTNPEISGHERTRGVSGYVIKVASLFQRLVECDLFKAKEEFAAWSADDDTAFCRLRVWAAGHQQLSTPHALFKIIMTLSDDVFWDSYHQRDLLLVLGRRWNEFSPHSKKRIEQRLLAGPSQWEHEDEAPYKERNSWSVLERLQWLANKNCEFSFDLQSEIKLRQSNAPKWEPKLAVRAADSREIRGGWVGRNTEYSLLLQEPIKSILSKASALSGRAEDTFLEQRDPFGGLCTERPVRAFLALTRAFKQEEYPIWAWRTFFSSQSLDNADPKLSVAIAERICRMPDQPLSKLIHESTWWLQKASSSLSEAYPHSLDKAVSRVINLLKSTPQESRSAVSDVGPSRDRILEAINSPTGHVVEAMFSDSRLEATNDTSRLPVLWISQLTELLNLEQESRSYAITIVARRLSWIYRSEPIWTEKHLISIVESDSIEDRAAFWDGFLFNPQVSNRELFFRLKHSLLDVAKEKSIRKDKYGSLAYLSTLGWISVDAEGQWLSNAEMRRLLLNGGEEFRMQVLWQIERGVDQEEGESRAEWLCRAKVFFENAWPRQKSVRTPAISGRLCRLLLSNPKSLFTLHVQVLPSLTNVSPSDAYYWPLPDVINDIVDHYPSLLLKVLDVALPEDVADWPYGISDALDRISTSHEELQSDPIYQNLRRKWLSR